MRQKVLVIDDAPMMHNLIVARLNNEDLEFISAYSGDVGLAKAIECAPDLILLDVEMPHPDGFEVCRQLSANMDTKNIPVIFLTGVSNTEQKIKGLNMGAVDYVTKPFEPAELLARVRASLRTKYLVDLLSRKAMLDGLTGLWNRAYFEQRLAAEQAHISRTPRPLACVMMDADKFKSINDTYGHPFGDTVLRRIAALAQSQCRQEDVLCRYGGEEFVILTPNVDGAGAARLAERIRTLIEAEKFQFNGTPVPVTCSFGVAEIQTFNELPLLDRADQALYDAKHGGRNQVRLCTGKIPLEPACT